MLFLSFALQPAFSQSTYFTEIGGDTLNTYTVIDTIYNPVDTVASVVVKDLKDFEEGDTVMVYCTKGSYIWTSQSDEDEIGKVDSDRPWLNFGHYSFLIIREIDVPRRLITMNNRMPDIKPLVSGEAAQLIKVRSFRNARVESTLEAPAWDPIPDLEESWYCLWSGHLPWMQILILAKKDSGGLLIP
ncbi:MAG: hypothetical protein ACWGNV_15950 [Bacteroidales bacterium]